MVTLSKGVAKGVSGGHFLATEIPEFFEKKTQNLSAVSHRRARGTNGVGSVAYTQYSPPLSKSSLDSSLFLP
jgi:hypothetical protein